MPDRAFIIDTNVLIAALPTINGATPFTWVLKGMLAAVFPFAVSDALLLEYQSVLLRPKLCKLHGLTEFEVVQLVQKIAQRASLVTPVQTVAAPDAGDQLLWDLLAARDDLLLVTQDKVLLKDKRMRSRLITPQRFSELLTT